MIGAGFMPWRIDATAALQGFRAMQGGEALDITAVPGGARVALLPVPALSLSGATVTRRDGTFAAEFGATTVKLGALALLRGRFEPKSVVAANALIQSPGPADFPAAALSMLVRIANEAAGPVSVRNISFGRGLDGGAPLLALESLAIRPVPANTAAEIAADGVWKGEAFSLSAVSPAGAASSPARFTLKSRLLTAEFQGETAAALRGRLTARAPMAKHAADWLGVFPNPLPRAFD